MAKKTPLERSNLEKELFAQRITEEMLAAHIGRSVSYISNRMKGRYSWTVSEAYRILELLHKDPRDIAIYFPPKEGFTCEKLIFCVG